MLKLLAAISLLSFVHGTDICKQCISTGRKFSINTAKLAFCSDKVTKAPGFTRFVSTTTAECNFLTPIIQKFKINSVGQLEKSLAIIQSNATSTETTYTSTQDISLISFDQSTEASTSVNTEASTLIAQNPQTETKKVYVPTEVYDSIAFTQTSERTTERFHNYTETKIVPDLTPYSESTTERDTGTSGNTQEQAKISTTISSELFSMERKRMQNDTEVIKADDVMHVQYNFTMTPTLSVNNSVMSTARPDNLTVKEAKLWRALYRAYKLTKELERKNHTTTAMIEFNKKNPFSLFMKPNRVMLYLTKGL